MPYAKRSCEVCTSEFQPRNDTRRAQEFPNRCANCRDIGIGALLDRNQLNQDIGAGIPQTKFDPSAEWHTLAAPMTQCVFDLETWGLDRGWGVLLMGSFLVWKGSKPEMVTVSLRDFKPWEMGVRSDDSALTKAIFEILSEVDIVYAHNGRNFDMKWLRTLALKHNLEYPRLKLVDPVQIARKNYRIGSNALGSLANFLNLSEKKMPLGEETWRHALLDNDDASWKLLQDRCESDVRVLAQVAGHVTRDAGMIDADGSAWRG